MADAAERRDGRPLVMIAGGGVAALEAALALRQLARKRVRIELLCPVSEFVFRPLLIAEPFGKSRAPRVPLAELVEEVTVDHVLDGVAEVLPERRRVRTTSGGERAFDALLVALGARGQQVLPGAVTFDGGPGIEAYRALLRELERGEIKRLVFTLPSESGWALPLYELALLTAARLFERGIQGAELSLVTPEPAPLAEFGRGASQEVGRLLDANQIRVQVDARVEAVAHGGVRLADGSSVPADRVVALPRLEGPRLAGLPHDDAGFVPVDDLGRVQGLEDVYAAGDVANHPVKQGGLATQQADAAASAIAAWAGAPVRPAPYRPVMRGLLLTGQDPLLLAGDYVGSPRERSLARRRPMPQATGKIVGRYLTTFLARHVFVGPPPEVVKLASIAAGRAG